jgi:hypothetical protein
VEETGGGGSQVTVESCLIDLKLQSDKVRCALSRYPSGTGGN